MRLLVTIPHFFRPSENALHGSQFKDPTPRIQALQLAITSLHQMFGPSQYMIDIANHATLPANLGMRHEVTVLVCTTQNAHLLDKIGLPQDMYQHVPTDVPPLALGYACQKLLHDRIGSYDMYAFMEDDLIIFDPLFIQKIKWFAESTGGGAVLQPNRYELSLRGQVRKAYLDGDLREDVILPRIRPGASPGFNADILGMPVGFQLSRNPHAGCYFLTASQMAHWASQPHFCDGDVSFVGPLESAATLGLLKTFSVYKTTPATAGFLEILHFGDDYLRIIGTDQVRFVP